MTELLPFFLFAFSTIFTPGPNNFLLLNSGLHFGIKKSLPHYLGICIGFPMMILIVALGFGALLAEYQWLHHFFKIAGTAYMLYLAWKILKSNPSAEIDDSIKPFTFMQAVLFQWINPKAWMIAVGVISIFSLTDSYLSNALAIGMTYLFITIPCLAVWLVFGAYLKKFLKEDRHFRWFNIAMALTLVASIVMIYVE